MQDEVQKKLLGFKEEEAPGPDGLHPKALKELASLLGIPFAILFNKSLQEGVFITWGLEVCKRYRYIQRGYKNWGRKSSSSVIDVGAMQDDGITNKG